jgi:hypothetical protein
LPAHSTRGLLTGMGDVLLGLALLSHRIPSCGVERG